MLRPYQAEMKSDILADWAGGKRNVLSVLPTGAGKTVLLADIVRDNPGASCVIAHRQELVGQISKALNREHVRHRIIGPTKVIKSIVSSHMRDIGRSYFDPSARTAVAGVDTLVRRSEQLREWGEEISLWVMDEAHHVLTENKWGKAVAMFPNARGLGVTATPLRADGKGLGRDNDGVFDSMLVGPNMRDLIEAPTPYLTDYKIFAPASQIDLNSVSISTATGDYSKPSLTNAMRESKIVGDVVQHYIRIAMGKKGVTFVTDVKTAGEVSDNFNAQGVPSKMVHAGTVDSERTEAVLALEAGEILQLVNVDLFGEGFDLPVIEVVSFARPTASYGLFAQQFGRGLRLSPGKTHAIIIDHVGNVLRHGLPDSPREWSLDRREKRGGSSSASTLKVCPQCTAVYDRFRSVCSECGFKPIPLERSGPEHVDGDLMELDAETLAQLREAVAHTNIDPEAYRAQLIARNFPKIAQLAGVKRFAENQEAQARLRDAIAWWAGYQRSRGRSDSESYRRFYITYGVDVMTAQTLKTKETIILMDKLRDENNINRTSGS